MTAPERWEFDLVAGVATWHGYRIKFTEPDRQGCRIYSARTPSGGLIVIGRAEKAKAAEFQRACEIHEKTGVYNGLSDC